VSNDLAQLQAGCGRSGSNLEQTAQSPRSSNRPATGKANAGAWQGRLVTLPPGTALIDRPGRAQAPPALQLTGRQGDTTTWRSKGRSSDPGAPSRRNQNAPRARAQASPLLDSSQVRLKTRRTAAAQKRGEEGKHRNGASTRFRAHRHGFAAPQRPRASSGCFRSWGPIGMPAPARCCKAGAAAMTNLRREPSHLRG